MLQPARSRLSPLIPACLFALTAAWCTALYQPRTTPITFDNQTFFYIAERAASGVPPYLSVVNHKHALSHLLSAGAIFAGRAAGVDDVMAARALSIAACALLVALIGVLAHDLTRSGAAAALAGIATLLYSPLLRQAAMGFRPHLYAALFVVAALVAYARRRDVLAGAWATAAFLCWQPAVAVAIALLAASLTDPRDRMRSPPALAVGAASVMLPYEAYFFAKGALAEQLFQTWTMASYGALGKVPMPWDTLRFLFDSDSRSRWIPALLPVALAVAGVFLTAWALRAPGSALMIWRERREVRAAALTFAVALAFTFLDHQAFPDKFTLVPFMAVAAGWLAALAATHAAPYVESPRTVLLVFATLSLTGAWKTAIEGRRNTDSLAIQREVAARLRSPDPEHPSVWAVGCLHLLAFNRQSNFSPVGALFDARVRAAVGPEYRPLRDGRMPRVVLIARLGKKNRPAWLAEEYEDRTSREFDDEGVHVWLRRANAPKPAAGDTRTGDHAPPGGA